MTGAWRSDLGGVYEDTVQVSREKLEKNLKAHLQLNQSTIHMDVNWLEKWAYRNLTKFHEEKCTWGGIITCWSAN